MPSSTGSAPPMIALVGPVEPVRARLVGDPVLVGIPERPGLEHHHLPAAPGQALGERAAARAGADDHQVDRVVVVVARHPLARARRGGGRRAGTPSRCPAGAARPASSVRSSWRRLTCRSELRARGVLTGVALERRRRPPSSRAARRRAGRSRAGRRGRRSRSRSTPTGASRTRSARARITTFHALRGRQLVPHLAVQLAVGEGVDDRARWTSSRRAGEVARAVLARRPRRARAPPAARSRGRRACRRSESRRARRRTASRRPCSAPGSSARGPGPSRGRRRRRACAPPAR